MTDSSFKTPAKSARQIFLDGLEQGRLLYQYDEAAQRAIFYPREIGPSGQQDALTWRESRKMGCVYSFTVIHKAQTQKNIVLVDLDEGFRIMSTVVNCDPEALRIGMRVRTRIEEAEDGRRVVCEVTNDL